MFIEAPHALDELGYGKDPRFEGAKDLYPFSESSQNEQRHERPRASCR